MKRFFSYLQNNYATLSKIGLFMATVVLLVLIFPKEGTFKYEFNKGKPWMHKDLIAPFDFSILKSEQEIEKEKEEIVQGLNIYFRNDQDIANEMHATFKNNFENKWSLKYTQVASAETKKIKHLQFGLQILDSLLRIGIIEPLTALEQSSESVPVYLINGNEMAERNSADFLSIQSADRLISALMIKKPAIDSGLLISALEGALNYNIVYDAETTEKEKQDHLNQLSLTHGFIQSGERIIAQGELVTDKKFQILQSLKQDYEQHMGSSLRFTGILIGQIILISILLSTLFMFIYFFKKKIYNEPRILIMILLLISFIVTVTSFVMKYNPAYIYLIPVCLVPLIVGVFTDSRLALFVHLVSIIITGFIVPNSYEYVFLQLLAGIITILSMVKLERRSQFFFTSLMIFLTYSVSYLGMTLIKEGNLNDINKMNFAMFAGSGLFTLFSYPVIYVFEKIFGLITNVTLMELSNTNNNLLRDLALKAPGTFQHSMQMANLAEAAIHEIGGNPLLVRTGAMYHDIGKMDDPLFFIENQTTGVNPHDELSNDESSEVIIEHIPRGVELARKNKLPEQIIDFIRTHHGTRRTEYFYIMEQKDNPDEIVDAQHYTYPGPAPFSKETAVLMMADTVEAASRSLKVPDEESIDKLVENVINKQIESKQFDNADITLKDIKTIKSVFKKKLMNIYHLRIEYPT